MCGQMEGLMVDKSNGMFRLAFVCVKESDGQDQNPSQIG
jgi:hypothetical protein